jgi:hypothetical protein
LSVAGFLISGPTPPPGAATEATAIAKTIAVETAALAIQHVFMGTPFLTAW